MFKSFLSKFTGLQYDFKFCRVSQRRGHLDYETIAHVSGFSCYFFEEVAKQAAAAANGFFLREPQELSHLTDLIVRLQSVEFGLENFKHFNLEHALDKIVELYLEALKLKDGIERTIGLVLNSWIHRQADCSFHTIVKF